MSINTIPTISSISLVTVTGGTISTSRGIANAPSRFLNGYAFGTKATAPLHDMGPVHAKVEGVLSGLSAAHNPETMRNLLGADIRRDSNYSVWRPTND
jgi:hypothetical protein